MRDDGISKIRAQCRVYQPKSRRKAVLIDQIKYKIENGGIRRAFFEGKDTGIQLFKFTSGDTDVYFECHFHFEENGNDFRVFIRNFGIRHATLAGSTTSTVQMKFGQAEAQEIRKEIIDYFTNTPPEIFPFKFKKSKMVGIDFESCWIATKENHRPR